MKDGKNHSKYSVDERKKRLEEKYHIQNLDLTEEQQAAVEWMCNNVPNKHIDAFETLMFGKRRNKSGGGRKPKELDPSMYFVIQDRKYNGENYGDIADELGMDPKTLRKWMKQQAHEVAKTVLKKREQV